MADTILDDEGEEVGEMEGVPDATVQLTYGAGTYCDTIVRRQAHNAPFDTDTVVGPVLQMYLVMQNRDRVSFPSSSDLETFCGYVESLSNMVYKVLQEEEGCTRYEKSKTVKNGPIASRANLAQLFAKLGSSPLTMVKHIPPLKIFTVFA